MEFATTIEGRTGTMSGDCLVPGSVVMLRIIGGKAPFVVVSDVPLRGIKGFAGGWRVAKKRKGPKIRTLLIVSFSRPPRCKPISVMPLFHAPSRT
jgi:hypothetical protein